jgi:hypothetical protein
MFRVAARLSKLQLVSSSTNTTTAHRTVTIESLLSTAANKYHHRQLHKQMNNWLSTAGQSNEARV